MIATLYAPGPWTQGPQTEQRKTTEVYAVPVLEASSPNSSVAESCSLKDSSKGPSYLSSSWGLQLFLCLWPRRHLAAPLRLLLFCLL